MQGAYGVTHACYVRVWVGGDGSSHRAGLPPLPLLHPRAGGCAHPDQEQLRKVTLLGFGVSAQ